MLVKCYHFSLETGKNNLCQATYLRLKENHVAGAATFFSFLHTEENVRSVMELAKDWS